MNSSKPGLESSIDIQPVELKIGQSGKMTLAFPHLKLSLSSLRLRLLFLPFLSVPQSEIDIESAPLEINLGDGHIKGEIQPPGPISSCSR